MRFILGVLIGIAAGAVFGLIIAPQSGKETRSALQRRVHRAAEDAQHEAEAETVRASQA